MNANGVALTLRVGEPLAEPAPAWLVSAIDSVSVTQRDSAPSGFQISFSAERTVESGDNFNVLNTSLLEPGNRVSISVNVLGTPSVLMEGFITNQQLMPETPGAEGRLVVTGEDVSVAMDLYEYSLEYPELPDFAIVNLILAKWLALGVVPEVIPSPAGAISPFSVKQQTCTDRAYIQQLAAQAGYQFCIKPGPSVGMSVAYWGPQPRLDSPQPALTAGVGPGSNVEEISFTYDQMSAQRYWGLVQNKLTGDPLPLATVDGIFLKSFATTSTLAGHPLFSKTNLFQDPGEGYADAFVSAQTQTNLSAQNAVTAQGKLDGLRYGHVLTAPGVVDVRGVGTTYDGTYYVSEVTHNLSRKGYDQSFTLSREGTGTTISTVNV